MLEELWNSEEVIKLTNDYEAYIVTDEKLNGEDIDKDRCSYTWENLYRKYYTKIGFWKDADFNEDSKGEICYKKSGEKINISGDMLFNFKSKEDVEDDSNKLKKKKKKFNYEIYQDLISNEKKFSDSQKSQYQKILDFCNKMTYTLHNFGLMPVDGGLQSVKKKYGDRPDRYIYYINEFYKVKDGERKRSDLISRIIPASRPKNNETKEQYRERLDTIKNNLQNKVMNDLNYYEKEFIENPMLDIYSNDEHIMLGTYKYCVIMYIIIEDKGYINQLIENGIKEIKRGVDVVDYMELAIKYWLIKEKMFSNSSEKGGVSN